MPIADIQLVFQWWSALFVIGVAAFPITKRLFSSWYDRGYFFSKAVGFALVPYIIFLLGTFHIAPFTTWTIVIALATVLCIGILWNNLKFTISNLKSSEENFNVSNFKHFELFSNFKFQISNFKAKNWKQIVLIVLEEAFFFSALLLWAWVKAHEPSIQGLEKFMDYGFMQSILNSRYFPAADMWWAGGSINYYYFGHLVTAVLTRLSGLDLSVTFNLMLATLFSLTLTMSFSIGYQLMEFVRKTQKNPENSEHSESQKVRGSEIQRIRNFRFSDFPSFPNALSIPSLLNGILTSFLVTLSGNMQTLYAFTKGYTGENVVPFWTVLWGLSDIGGIGGIWDGTLLGKLGEGMNRYWYANATRFIPFTIHEFPSYSFVVSDVHGHVLSIPFVLLSIALLIVIFSQSIQNQNSKHEARNPKQIQNLNFQNRKLFRFGILDLRSFVSNFDIRISDFLTYILYGFLLGVLLMTNALDGPIYFGLLGAILILSNIKNQISKTEDQRSKIFSFLIPLSIVGITLVLTALPFLIHFKSFATGIGVNCPPGFLANTKIGPFLFEGVEKCQKSPLWMMSLLWGFFWFTGAWLFLRKIWENGQYDSPINRILKVFYIFGIVLIIIPEFFYVKDIYPAHFRSNTMFKLGYEAFILWSIVSAYVIVHFVFQRSSPLLISKIKDQKSKIQIKNQILRIFFFILLLPQLFLVSIYPLFSIRSYFGELKTYKSIDGLEWLRSEYPSDFEAIQWLKNQSSPPVSSFDKLTTTMTRLSVIVEADGDSYTDYNHISAFSGVPTITGWAVHEWLWRGGYELVSPRRDDVRRIYESTDADEVRAILTKYNVRYIVVGKLEREKFTNLKEDQLSALGVLVFQSGDTVIYEVGDQ